MHFHKIQDSSAAHVTHGPNNVSGCAKKHQSIVCKQHCLPRGVLLRDFTCEADGLIASLVKIRCRWYSKTLIMSVHLAGKWIESEAAPQRGLSNRGRQTVCSSSEGREWEGNAYLFIHFLGEQLESLAGILCCQCCRGGKVMHILWTSVTAVVNLFVEMFYVLSYNH